MDLAGAFRGWGFGVALAALVSFGAGGGTALANTCTWTGVTNGNFATTTNWSGCGGVAPQSTDDVVVDGTVSLSVNTGATITVKSLTINSTYTKTVTQNGSTPLHTTGNFAIAGGTFTGNSASTVQVGGSLTASGGTFTTSGATVTATGSLTVSGGTVSASSSTLTAGGLAVSSGSFSTSSGAVTVNGNLSVSGTGTFTGNTGSVQITGNLSLTGGSFTATGGTTQIGGAFSRTAGNTFDANGGTILLSSTTARSHTFAGATMANVIVNDGLVGYWSFDDKKITDSSGYGNTGTKNGTTSFAATVPGTIGFADPWDFTPDGASGYAQVAAPVAMPAAGGAQTISLWAQFASSTTTQAMVALTGTGSAVEVGLGVVGGTGHIRVWKAAGTDLANVTAPVDGAWHHIAYTFDGTTDKLYLDGTPTSGLGVGHDAGAPTSVFIGADSASTNFFNGSVDEVRVYNRALNAREIASMASGQMPATGIATHTFADAFTTANNDDFVIASGTVAGSSAISVGGDWFNYGGLFTNTATVALTTTSSRTLLSGGQSFSNLSMSGSGTYTLADRLWVPGGTVTISASGNINGGAYVAHIGTLADPSNQWVRGTGTVILDGSSDQNLTTKTFFGLRIEDPSESNLVAYWKLDEAQGTTFRDVSGSGNTGTLFATGTTWTGAPGSVSFDDAAALKLDGATGYASMGVTNLPAANATQTISLWAKLGSTSGIQNLVALVASAATSGVQIGLRNNLLSAWTWGGTALVSVTPPGDGAWHHIAYTWDGTTDRLYLDGVVTSATGATPHQAATPTAAYLGTYNGSAELYGGSLDDVRVYNKTLSAAQITQLAAGRYAGTGGVATVTLTGTALSIPIGDFGFVIDSGNFYTNDQTVTVSVTTAPCIVNSGTLHLGSKVTNCDGGLTINPMGTLLMDTSGGQFQPGKNSTLAIDGTLIASNTGALIERDNGSEHYTFKVGTTATATPTLNITGLTIKDTDASGVQINANTSAVTTFTHFDNIVFGRGTTGVGSEYLQIYSKVLYLSSNGCTFGSGEGAAALPAAAVKLTGNGTADGETRAIFGTTTCATSWAVSSTCVSPTTPKSDDDSGNDGVGDNPATNGAVVQFVRAAEDDTSGTIVGFPTAAFDWNTFTYYSTYVAFHGAIGGNDAVYVRSEAGAPLYSWTAPSGETIIGTPKWTTVSSKHYLYVATTAGHVYRLVDNATGTTSGSLTLDASGAWATNPYNANGTITTPLTADASNLYFGGNPTAGGHAWWTVGQAAESIPTGSPFPITPTITSAAPSVWTVGGTSYLMLGLTGHVLKISLTSQAVVGDNSSPGTASVWGRISVGSSHTGGFSRVYAGDDNGTMWAIDPAAGFATGGGLWSYHTANAILGSSYYDNLTDTIAYGTQGGTVIVLNGSGAVLNSSYPYTPGSVGDAITAAPLYYSGVLAVGSTGGKLYFLDRNNGASTPAAALIREYYFGPGEAVSTISFDPTVNRYMVTTANPASKDGHLYYFDLIADPTPGSS